MKNVRSQNVLIIGIEKDILSKYKQKKVGVAILIRENRVDRNHY